MNTPHFNGRALRWAIATVIAAGSGAFGVNGHADTKRADLAVTASISDHCAISTVPATSGAVTTTCTDGSLVAVTLSQEASTATTDSASAPTGILVATVLY